MDTELARTFLAVVADGSFSSAAHRLNVTQSTVSIRMRTLEDRLGRRLLNRHKNGIKMTPAGERFYKHAAVIVRAVEQARQEVGMPSAYLSSLRIGARFGLWEKFLPQWLSLMKDEMAETSIRGIVGFDEELIVQVVEGMIDIGLMYAPQSRSGLVIEPLLEETLVLVSTTPDEATAFSPSYVFVDWGPDFLAQHSLIYPDYAGSQFVASIGWLGLQQVLQNGGSGYFPYSVVGEFIASNRLYLVSDAAQFRLPAYLVHLADKNNSDTLLAIESLRNFAQSWSQEQPNHHLVASSTVG